MRAGECTGTVAIAGAGIAGLSAAIALRLAGFSVAIFERETVLKEVGAGIQMGPNATRIMESWDLDLLGDAAEPDSIELRNAISGSLLNTIPLRRAARIRYGSPYITLLRADLQKALLDRAKELEIPISYGTPVSLARDEGGRVDLEAAGSALPAAAALIGADGVKSAVREMAGFHPRRFSAQAVAWRGLVQPSALPAAMRNVTVVWMAPGAHLVHYPISGGEQINAVLVIDDIYPGDGGDIEDAAAYLSARLEGWGGLPRSLIAAAPAWLRWRMFGIEKWEGGSGRIQLIGDAWHAMRPYLASGGAMAIEDGGALAASLTESQGDIVEGLKLFRKNRGRRVWRVARASAQMGRIYNCPQPFDLVRDLVLRVSSGSMLFKWNDWLYGLGRDEAPRKG
jgi:salicylate hydroxylase